MFLVLWLRTDDDDAGDNDEDKEKDGADDTMKVTVMTVACVIRWLLAYEDQGSLTASLDAAVARSLTHFCPEGSTGPAQPPFPLLW